MLKTVSSVTNALGALVYQGTWDANANNPTLSSSVGTKGNYYVVSVAGTTTLNGISLWSVGDWAVFNGSVWQKVDGGSSEAFVNLTVSGTANIATGNVTNLVSENVTITGGSENAVTYTNVTVSSGNITVTNANLTYANIVTALRTQGLTGYLYGNDNTGNVSAATTIPNVGLANSTATLGNATITLGSTTTSVGNLTLTNVIVSSGNVTANLSTSTSIPIANATGTLATGNGGTGLTSFTANGVMYASSTSVLSTSSSLTWNGTTFSTTNGGGAKSQLSGNTLLLLNSTSTASGYVSFQRSDGTQKAAIGSYYNIANEGNLEFISGSTTNMALFASGGLSLGNTTDPGTANLSVNGSSSYFNTTTAPSNTKSGNSYLSLGSNVIESINGITVGTTATQLTKNTADGGFAILNINYPSQGETGNYLVGWHANGGATVYSSSTGIAGITLTFSTQGPYNGQLYLAVSSSNVTVNGIAITDNRA